MAPRRTSREPDVDPASPFAPVVEAARTMIRMLLSALPDDEHARELVKARAEGMEGIVLLCQRAGAGEVLIEGGQRLVKLRAVREAAPDNSLESRVARLERELRAMRPAPSILEPPAPTTTTKPAKRSKRPPTLAPLPATSALPLGETRVLSAIAQHPDGVTRTQLTALTGYKRSTRDKHVQRLKADGLVEEPGRLVATASGREKLGDDFTPLPVGDALARYWLDRLPEGERRCLECVLAEWPGAVTRERLSEVTGYKRSTRDKHVQALKRRELVTDTRGVRARDELFSRRP